MQSQKTNKKRKNIKFNFFWQVGIEITNMMLPLVTSPILARRLGAEAIGIYSYINSITYYFIIVALLGIFQYGTREIAMVRDDPQMLNRRFSELLLGQVIVGIIVLISFLIYAIFISKYPPLFLIETINLLGSSMLLINWLFSGLEEFRAIALKTMVIRILGVVLIVCLVKTSVDLPIYFWIMSMEPFLGSLVYIYLAKDKVKLVPVRLAETLKHIKGMLLLFVPVLTTYLYSSMDKIMIGKISTMTQLGFYENATKALIARNLATALSTVLVPRMANLFGQKNNKKFDDLMKKSLDAVFLLTVASGFGTAAVSTIFSVVFWGENFWECGKLIFIMSMTIPAYGLTYVINNQFLVPLKKENIYIWATAMGVGVNFILNFHMIPRYAALGAAVATLITQYIVLVVEAIAIRKELSMLDCIKRNLIYVLFGILMIIAIRYVDMKLNVSIISLFIEILVGMFLFLVMCFIYWLIIGEKNYLNLVKNLIYSLKRK